MTQVYTDVTIQPVMYSDFGVNMTVHPVKKDLSLLTNDLAVIQSVKNIIQTNFYERPYQPRIGSGLVGMLFEQFTPQSQMMMESAITKAINNYEPRANLIAVNVSCNLDTGSVSAQIIFGMNNKTQPVILNMPLTRAR